MRCGEEVGEGGALTRIFNLPVGVVCVCDILFEACQLLNIE